MGDLSVRVELHDLVVVDQVLEVKAPIVVGDWPTAEVSFPGASIRISRSGKHLRVLGKELAEGERTSITLGAIQIYFEHTSSARPMLLRESPFDRKFLAVALVMIAVGTWFDAAEGWMDRLPSSGPNNVGLAIRDAVDAVRSPNRRQWSAAVSPVSELSPTRLGPQGLGEGPRRREAARAVGA